MLQNIARMVSRCNTLLSGDARQKVTVCCNQPMSSFCYIYGCQALPIYGIGSPPNKNEKSVEMSSFCYIYGCQALPIYGTGSPQEYSTRTSFLQYSVLYNQ
jgi:hypothetical protein